MNSEENLSKLIKEAKQIMIFTGAGISTGSGIPDFRGPQGVWKKRKPVYYQDFMTSEKARLEYWDYKLEGWEQFRTALPNETHRSIVDLYKHDKLLITLTQNIDGLHRKAGLPDDKLVELHGTNSLIECQTCGELTDPEQHFEFFRKTQKSPKCHCNGFLKPATISFGQNLRQDDLERSYNATDKADLVISLGSTLSVHPAASFPLAAAQKGTSYVIINQGDTDHDHYDVVSIRLQGDVQAIFPNSVATALC